MQWPCNRLLLYIYTHTVAGVLCVSLRRPCFPVDLSTRLLYKLSLHTQLWRLRSLTGYTHTHTHPEVNKVNTHTVKCKVTGHDMNARLPGMTIFILIRMIVVWFGVQNCIDLSLHTRVTDANRYWLILSVLPIGINEWSRSFVTSIAIHPYL